MSEPFQVFRRDLRSILLDFFYLTNKASPILPQLGWFGQEGQMFGVWGQRAPTEGLSQQEVRSTDFQLRNTEGRRR